MGSAPLLGEPLPVELMNTVWADRHGVHDALADRAAELAWLRTIADRLPVEIAGRAPSDLGLRPLRDALRRLAADVTADPRPAGGSAIDDRTAALAVLNAACARVPDWPELRWPAGDDPIRIVRADRPPAEHAVALLAGRATELFAGPQRDLLRACLAPGCVLYYVRDHPRREWCSAACGNRARVARHYRRHHDR